MTQRPMYDADDGVYRCTLCAWELDEEGVCENPGCRKRWDLPAEGGGEEEGGGGGRGAVRGVQRDDISSDEALADGEEGVNDEDGSELDGSYESSFINDSGLSVTLVVARCVLLCLTS